MQNHLWTKHQPNPSGSISKLFPYQAQLKEQKDFYTRCKQIDHSIALQFQNHPHTMHRTSIIPGLMLFLLASNAYARNVIYPDYSTSLQPIMTQSRRTRICTELCMSGLGGTPCGDSCFDLIPTNLPIAGRDTDSQNNNNSGSSSSQKYNVTTREDSCDVLCKNKLGYPLCACTYEENTPYAPDFMEICSAFCVSYNYQISGCQTCDIYKQFASNSSSEITMFQTSNLSVMNGSTGKVLTIGWNTWCKDRCSTGNGGAACNCDLLP